MDSSTAGYYGQAQPADSSSEVNALRLLINRMLARVRTATLVQVKAVTNSGGVSEVGFVEIEPLVSQVDGIGQTTPHATIFKCPYFRIQGGANAIILDPQIGDIGIAVFADRDISSATANKAKPPDQRQSNPGSRRRFSMADGLYLGGVLNGTPSQYVRFSSAGIEIHSPTQVKLTAPDVRIDATTVEINASTSATITTPTFTVNGNQVNNGTVAATGNITSSAQLAGNTVTDATGTMGAMRTAYNAHKGHGSPGTGNTPDHGM